MELNVSCSSASECVNDTYYKLGSTRPKQRSHIGLDRACDFHQFLRIDRESAFCLLYIYIFWSFVIQGEAFTFDHFQKWAKHTPAVQALLQGAFPTDSHFSLATSPRYGVTCSR